jgi:hypothetical protein
LGQIQNLAKAAGASAAASSGTIQSSEPDAVYQNFVQRCLDERGYDVIGRK